jgi:hypothetical protein
MTVHIFGHAVRVRFFPYTLAILGVSLALWVLIVLAFCFGGAR